MRVLTAVVCWIGSSPIAAQSPPATPFVIADVWPGECIGFGTWWATDSVSVHSNPSVGASVVTTLMAADTFQLVTGSLHVDQLGAVVLVRDIDVRWDGDDGFSSVPAGDTLWVLEDAPEAILHVWHQGRTGSSEVGVIGSLEEANRWPQYEAYWVVPWRATYWARVVISPNQSGWLNVTMAGGRLGTECFCC